MWWRGLLAKLVAPLLWLWSLICGVWRNAKSGFDPRSRRRRRLLSWAEQAAGRPVRDLAALWRDPSLLADIVSSPSPSDHIHSFAHIQELAYRRLLVPPMFSDEDLMESELNPVLGRRLFRYLHSIKRAVARRQLDGCAGEGEGEWEELEEESFVADEYVARGVGLIMASRQQPAKFYVYSRDGSSLEDILVEVHGPNGERGFTLVGSDRSLQSRSQSINVTYRLTDEYLRVSYQPRSLGQYELSVSRHGRPLPGSPFLITVDHISETLPQKRFNSMEWFSEDEDEKKLKRQERRKNARVVCRVVDFVTEKMYLTEEGELVKVEHENCDNHFAHHCPRVSDIYSTPESSPVTSSKPVNCGSLQDSTLSIAKNSSSNKHIKLVKQKPELVDEKLLQPEQRVNSLQRNTTPNVSIDSNLIQEKCKRILNVCNYMLQHFPRQKSLEIVSGAGHILHSKEILFSPQTTLLFENDIDGCAIDQPEDSYSNDSEKLYASPKRYTILDVDDNLKECKPSKRDRLRDSGSQLEENKENKCIDDGLTADDALQTNNGDRGLKTIAYLQVPEPKQIKEGHVNSEDNCASSHLNYHVYNKQDEEQNIINILAPLSERCKDENIIHNRTNRNLTISQNSEIKTTEDNINLNKTLNNISKVHTPLAKRSNTVSKMVAMFECDKLPEEKNLVKNENLCDSIEICKAKDVKGPHKFSKEVYSQISQENKNETINKLRNNNSKPTGTNTNLKPASIIKHKINLFEKVLNNFVSCSDNKITNETVSELSCNFTGRMMTERDRVGETSNQDATNCEGCFFRASPALVVSRHYPGPKGVSLKSNRRNPDIFHNIQPEIIRNKIEEEICKEEYITSETHLYRASPAVVVSKHYPGSLMDENANCEQLTYKSNTNSNQNSKVAKIDEGIVKKEEQEQAYPSSADKLSCNYNNDLNTTCEINSLICVERINSTNKYSLEGTEIKTNEELEGKKKEERINEDNQIKTENSSSSMDLSVDIFNEGYEVNKLTESVKSLEELSLNINSLQNIITVDGRRQKYRAVKIGNSFMPGFFSAMKLPVNNDGLVVNKHLVAKLINTTTNYGINKQTKLIKHNNQLGNISKLVSMDSAKNSEKHFIINNWRVIINTVRTPVFFADSKLSELSIETSLSLTLFCDITGPQFINQYFTRLPTQHNMCVVRDSCEFFSKVNMAYFERRLIAGFLCTPIGMTVSDLLALCDQNEYNAILSTECNKNNGVYNGDLTQEKYMAENSLNNSGISTNIVNYSSKVVEHTDIKYQCQMTVRDDSIAPVIKEVDGSESLGSQTIPKTFDFELTNRGMQCHAFKDFEHSIEILNAQSVTNSDVLQKLFLHDEIDLICENSNIEDEQLDAKTQEELLEIENMTNCGSNQDSLELTEVNTDCISTYQEQFQPSKEIIYCSSVPGTYEKLSLTQISEVCHMSQDHIEINPCKNELNANFNLKDIVTGGTFDENYIDTSSSCIKNEDILSSKIPPEECVWRKTNQGTILQELNICISPIEEKVPVDESVPVEESVIDRLISSEDPQLSISTDSDSLDAHTKVDLGEPLEAKSQKITECCSKIPNKHEEPTALEGNDQEKEEQLKLLVVRTPSPSLRSLEEYFRANDSSFDTDRFYAEVSGEIIADDINNRRHRSLVATGVVCDINDTLAASDEQIKLIKNTSHKETNHSTSFIENIQDCKYSYNLDAESCNLESDEDGNWIISPNQFPRIILQDTSHMSVIQEEEDSQYVIENPNSELKRNGEEQNKEEMETRGDDLYSKHNKIFDQITTELTPTKCIKLAANFIMEDEATDEQTENDTANAKLNEMKISPHTIFDQQISSDLNKTETLTFGNFISRELGDIRLENMEKSAANDTVNNPETSEIIIGVVRFLKECDDLTVEKIEQAEAYNTVNIFEHERAQEGSIPVYIEQEINDSNKTETPTEDARVITEHCDMNEDHNLAISTTTVMTIEGERFAEENYINSKQVIKRTSNKDHFFHGDTSNTKDIIGEQQTVNLNEVKERKIGDNFKTTTTNKSVTREQDIVTEENAERTVAKVTLNIEKHKQERSDHTVLIEQVVNSSNITEMLDEDFLIEKNYLTEGQIQNSMTNEMCNTIEEYAIKKEVTNDNVSIQPKGCYANTSETISVDYTHLKEQGDKHTDYTENIIDSDSVSAKEYVDNQETHHQNQFIGQEVTEITEEHNSQTKEKDNVATEQVNNVMASKLCNTEKYNQEINYPMALIEQDYDPKPVIEASIVESSKLKIQDTVDTQHINNVIASDSCNTEHFGKETTFQNKLIQQENCYSNNTVNTMMDNNQIQENKPVIKEHINDVSDLCKAEEYVSQLETIDQEKLFRNEISYPKPTTLILENNHQNVEDAVATEHNLESVTTCDSIGEAYVSEIEITYHNEVEGKIISHAKTTKIAIGDICEIKEHAETTVSIDIVIASESVCTEELLSEQDNTIFKKLTEQEGPSNTSEASVEDNSHEPIENIMASDTIITEGYTSNQKTTFHNEIIEQGACYATTTESSVGDNSHEAIESIMASNTIITEEYTTNQETTAQDELTKQYVCYATTTESSVVDNSYEPIENTKGNLSLNDTVNSEKNATNQEAFIQKELIEHEVCYDTTRESSGGVNSYEPIEYIMASDTIITEEYSTNQETTAQYELIQQDVCYAPTTESSVTDNSYEPINNMMGSDTVNSNTTTIQNELIEHDVCYATTTESSVVDNSYELINIMMGSDTVNSNTTTIQNELIEHEVCYATTTVSSVGVNSYEPIENIIASDTIITEECPTNKETTAQDEIIEHNVCYATPIETSVGDSSYEPIENMIASDTIITEEYNTNQEITAQNELIEHTVCYATNTESSVVDNSYEPIENIMRSNTVNSVEIATTTIHNELIEHEVCYATTTESSLVVESNEPIENTMGSVTVNLGEIAINQEPTIQNELIEQEVCYTTTTEYSVKDNSHEPIENIMASETIITEEYTSNQETTAQDELIEQDVCYATTTESWVVDNSHEPTENVITSNAVIPEDCATNHKITTHNILIEQEVCYATTKEFSVGDNGHKPIENIINSDTVIAKDYGTNQESSDQIKLFEQEGCYATITQFSVVDNKDEHLKNIITSNKLLTGEYTTTQETTIINELIDRESCYATTTNSLVVDNSHEPIENIKASDTIIAEEYSTNQDTTAQDKLIELEVCYATTTESSVVDNSQEPIENIKASDTINTEEYSTNPESTAQNELIEQEICYTTTTKYLVKDNSHEPIEKIMASDTMITEEFTSNQETIVYKELIENDDCYVTTRQSSVGDNSHEPIENIITSDTIHTEEYTTNQETTAQDELIKQEVCYATTRESSVVDNSHGLIENIIASNTLLTGEYTTNQETTVHNELIEQEVCYITTTESSVRNNSYKPKENVMANDATTTESWVVANSYDPIENIMVSDTVNSEKNATTTIKNELIEHEVCYATTPESSLGVSSYEPIVNVMGSDTFYSGENATNQEPTIQNQLIEQEVCYASTTESLVGDNSYEPIENIIARDLDITEEYSTNQKTKVILTKAQNEFEQEDCYVSTTESSVAENSGEHLKYLIDNNTLIREEYTTNHETTIHNELIEQEVSNATTTESLVVDNIQDQIENIMDSDTKITEEFINNKETSSLWAHDELIEQDVCYATTIESSVGDNSHEPIENSKASDTINTEEYSTNQETSAQNELIEQEVCYGTTTESSVKDNSHEHKENIMASDTTITEEYTTNQETTAQNELIEQEVCYVTTIESSVSGNSYVPVENIMASDPIIADEYATNLETINKNKANTVDSLVVGNNLEHIEEIILSDTVNAVEYISNQGITYIFEQETTDKNKIIEQEACNVKFIGTSLVDNSQEHIENDMYYGDIVNPEEYIKEQEITNNSDHETTNENKLIDQEVCFMKNTDALVEDNGHELTKIVIASEAVNADKFITKEESTAQKQLIELDVRHVNTTEPKHLNVSLHEAYNVEENVNKQEISAETPLVVPGITNSTTIINTIVLKEIDGLTEHINVATDDIIKDTEFENKMVVSNQIGLIKQVSFDTDSSDSSIDNCLKQDISELNVITEQEISGPSTTAKTTNILDTILHEQESGHIQNNGIFNKDIHFNEEEFYDQVEPNVQGVSDLNPRDTMIRGCILKENLVISEHIENNDNIPRKQEVTNKMPNSDPIELIEQIVCDINMSENTKESNYFIGENKSFITVRIEENFDTDDTIYKEKCVKEKEIKNVNDEIMYECDLDMVAQQEINDSKLTENITLGSSDLNECEEDTESTTAYDTSKRSNDMNHVISRSRIESIITELDSRDKTEIKDSIQIVENGVKAGYMENSKVGDTIHEQGIMKVESNDDVFFEKEFIGIDSTKTFLENRYMKENHTTDENMPNAPQEPHEEKTIPEHILNTSHDLCSSDQSIKEVEFSNPNDELFAPVLEETNTIESRPVEYITVKVSYKTAETIREISSSSTLKDEGHNMEEVTCKTNDCYNHKTRELFGIETKTAENVTCNVDKQNIEMLFDVKSCEFIVPVIDELNSLETAMDQKSTLDKNIESNKNDDTCYDNQNIVEENKGQCTAKNICIEEECIKEVKILEEEESYCENELFNKLTDTNSSLSAMANNPFFEGYDASGEHIDHATGDILNENILFHDVTNDYVITETSLKTNPFLEEYNATAEELCNTTNSYDCSGLKEMETHEENMLTYHENIKFVMPEFTLMDKNTVLEENNLVADIGHFETDNTSGKEALIMVMDLNCSMNALIDEETIINETKTSQCTLEGRNFLEEIQTAAEITDLYACNEEVKVYNQNVSFNKITQDLVANDIAVLHEIGILTTDDTTAQNEITPMLDDTCKEKQYLHKNEHIGSNYLFRNEAIKKSNMAETTPVDDYFLEHDRSQEGAIAINTCWLRDHLEEKECCKQNMIDGLKEESNKSEGLLVDNILLNMGNTENKANIESREHHKQYRVTFDQIINEPNFIQYAHLIKSFLKEDDIIDKPLDETIPKDDCIIKDFSEDSEFYDQSSALHNRVIVEPNFIQYTQRRESIVNASEATETSLYSVDCSSKYHSDNVIIINDVKEGGTAAENLGNITPTNNYIEEEHYKYRQSLVPNQIRNFLNESFAKEEDIRANYLGNITDISTCINEEPIKEVEFYEQNKFDVLLDYVTKPCMEEENITTEGIVKNICISEECPRKWGYNDQNNKLIQLIYETDQIEPSVAPNEVDVKEIAIKPKHVTEIGANYTNPNEYHTRENFLGVNDILFDHNLIKTEQIDTISEETSFVDGDIITEYLLENTISKDACIIEESIQDLECIDQDHLIMDLKNREHIIYETASVVQNPHNKSNMMEEDEKDNATINTIIQDECHVWDKELFDKEQIGTGALQIDRSEQTYESTTGNNTKVTLELNDKYLDNDFRESTSIIIMKTTESDKTQNSELDSNHFNDNNKSFKGENSLQYTDAITSQTIPCHRNILISMNEVQNTQFVNLSNKENSDPDNLFPVVKVGDEIVQLQNESKERFERAKKFFEQLETSVTSGVKHSDSKSKLELILSECKTSRPRVRKVGLRGRKRAKNKSALVIKSAPTSDAETSKRIGHDESFDSFGGSVRDRTFSERFNVIDIFSDVSEKVGTFRGTPNRHALLASLKSVDDASYVSAYQMDIDKPKNLANVGTIPSGFQSEYPYLPTTPIDKFLPRSDLENSLIPRNKLLKL